MKCTHCNSENLVKKGKVGIKQRYRCKSCNRYQQDLYSYRRYKVTDDQRIKLFNAEGVGIRSMSRILGYSPNTLIRRILYLAAKVTRPVSCEYNQVYEVDELWTFVGDKDPSHYCWITYAINQRTRSVIDIAFGSRSKNNLKKVIDSVKMQDPKRIVTDKLIAYPNLIKPHVHDTRRYANNRIERCNLTLRTHLKRLARKTLCFSKSQKMLEACVLLYLDYKYWRIKMY